MRDVDRESHSVQMAGTPALPVVSRRGLRPDRVRLASAQHRAISRIFSGHKPEGSPLADRIEALARVVRVLEEKPDPRGRDRVWYPMYWSLLSLQADGMLSTVCSWLDRLAPVRERDNGKSNWCIIRCEEKRMAND
jgi:hypothetical protein